jgi:hypothetical protein
LKHLDRVLALGMPSTKRVNTLVMIQKLQLVFEKSISKIDKPSCKKLSLGPRIQKGHIERKRVCMDLRFPH